MNVVLETRSLKKAFGGLVATNDISLRLERGERHALIGPNGAGKTTFVNLLTGVLKPDSGSVLLNGVDITGLSTHQRVRSGMARTFQINQLFPNLTPLEAVTLAICEREGKAGTWWRSIFSYSEIVDEARALLEKLNLADVLSEKTGVLSYGRQRLLEIALALACKPSALLLDEPAAGMEHSAREEILSMIEALPRDVSVLLIEHDMDLVFRYAERITVLVNGAVLVSGKPEDVAINPRVRKAYLGEGGHE